MVLLARLGMYLLVPFLAVIGRMLAQPVIEKLIAKFLFWGMHKLAAKTTNQVDDATVKLIEDQYYGRTT